MNALLLIFWLFLQHQNPTDLEGTIVLPTSQVTAEVVTVFLETITGTPVDRTIPDATGHFRFYGVASGPYILRVDHPGFQQVRKLVNLPLSTMAVVALRLLLLDAANSPGRPLDGNYTVALSELKLPAKAKREYEMGIKDSLDGDTKHSLEHLGRAVELAPTYYRAHLALAREFEQVGRAEDAERQFLKAVEVKPNQAEAFLRLGEMHLRSRNNEKAAEAFRSAAQRDPGSARIASQLGLALYLMNRIDDAETALVQAQRLEPTNPIVHLLMINLLVKQGRLKNALKQVDGYLQENPYGDKRREVQEIRAKLLGLLSKP